MTFLDTLRERGFIHQCTDEAGLAARLTGHAVGYIGFDCTASSFHVGTLLPLMMLRHFQAAGHVPIIVLGGGTSMVGDPSGKDATRQILSPEQIASNKASLARIFEKFVATDGACAAMMLDNAYWLTDLRFIDFLRQVGPHFSINRMLAMDSVRTRVERQQEMSLLEFNYMVLQSYDFIHLATRYGCVLQMGGSDQWGNIVNGIDLGRRCGLERLFGLTCPLIQTATGAKMGKSEGGAIWLDADRTSPFEFWQFWRDTDDRDVERFLKLFTICHLDTIAEVMAGDINAAKRFLAWNVTEMIHGPRAALFETFEEDGSPRLQVRVHSMASDGGTIAHVCVAIGMFPSLSRARSNGFDRPLVEGERLTLTKRKIAVDVIA